MQRIDPRNLPPEALVQPQGLSSVDQRVSKTWQSSLSCLSGWATAVSTLGFLVTGSPALGMAALVAGFVWLVSQRAFDGGCSPRAARVDWSGPEPRRLLSEPSHPRAMAPGWGAPHAEIGGPPPVFSPLGAQHVAIGGPPLPPAPPPYPSMPGGGSVHRGERAGIGSAPLRAAAASVPLLDLSALQQPRGPIHPMRYSGNLERRAQIGASSADERAHSAVAQRLPQPVGHGQEDRAAIRGAPPPISDSRAPLGQRVASRNLVLDVSRVAAYSLGSPPLGAPRDPDDRAAIDSTRLIIPSNRDRPEPSAPPAPSNRASIGRR